MKNCFVYLLFAIGLPICAQTPEITIRGTVTDVWETPIPNAHVLVKHTDHGTYSDTMGQFVIKAMKGEILVISSVGYASVEFVVNEELQEFKVALSPQTTKLKEVVVNKRKRKRQKDLLAEYPENKNLIKTSFGIIDKDRSSQAMRFVDGKSLINVGPDFLTSLKNHVPNMRVVRPPHAPDVEVYLRRIAYADTTSPPKALFDVDGILLESAPTYLSAGDIDRLVVLERNAAISKYGPKGVGGVVVVNTTAQSRIDNMGVVRRYDNSAMRDSLYNLFDQKAHYVPKSPGYMDAFGRATSLMEAKAILQSLWEIHEDDPHYFLDLAQYFRGRWKDDNTANNLLRVVGQRFSHNIPVMRSLAYNYEVMNRNEEALGAFIQVLQLDSLSAQSYIDLVTINVALDNLGKASEFRSLLETYQKKGLIPHITDPNDDLGALPEQNMETLGNGISRNKGVVAASPIQIALAWSNPNVNFGLQLVNPMSQYKTWSNTDNAQMKLATAQISIKEHPEGEWDVKLQYFEGDITYLRITVSFDQGPSPYKKQLLFKLAPEYQGNHLFSINTKDASIVE